MEIKKSPKADLESKKSTWLLVGYVTNGNHGKGMGNAGNHGYPCG